MRQLGTAKIVRVSLDEPLRALEVEDCYGEVLILVVSAGAVIFTAGGMATGVEVKNDLGNAPVRQGAVAFRDDTADHFTGDRILDGNKEPGILPSLVGTNRTLGEKKNSERKRHIPYGSAGGSALSSAKSMRRPICCCSAEI